MRLDTQGNAHYIRLGKERVFLFSGPNQKLPKWFLDYGWSDTIKHIKTSILPNGLAIKEKDFCGINIKMSSRERAILESLYLSPEKFELLECYQMTESLMTLRPKILQELLEQCTSVRVKRLFLYMADKAELPVLGYLDLDKIDLGKGDRSIVKNGVYNSQYKISIPRELVNYI